MRSIHLNTTYYYQYYAILLSILHNTTLLPFSGARAVTPESEDENLIPSQPVSPLPTPASSPLPDTGRRKASAAVTSINPAHVLATVSGHRPESSEDFINDIASYYVVPDGEQSDGIESDQFRAGLKRRADGISRSEYEVYSFSTKYNLTEKATDELLEMVSNVSYVQVHLYSYSSGLIYLCLSGSFSS